jgi:flavin-dependent dehydrogenase
VTSFTESPGSDRSAGTITTSAVDVVIIGGGPAGTSTAIALAQLGWSATVLERSCYESIRLGETLPPEIRQPLVALGVWEQFLADGPMESPGITAAWGHPELYENDFIVNPHGPGWHVDRRRFDLMLANSATTSGVNVLRGARQVSITPASPNTWYVDAVADGQRIKCVARMLVDATGRYASPVRRLAGRRLMYDQLVGLAAFTDTHGHTGDRRTLIEAVETGWWYCSPLPDGSQLGVFMSDGDLLPTGQAARLAFWRNQLRQADHTWSRIGSIASVVTLRAVSACSSRSASIAGDNWVAVGDAAAAFDPLSSQGVAWALESGLMAAAAIDGRLCGKKRALYGYAFEVRSEFLRYLQLRANYYGHERRWPQSPFWQRRHKPWQTVNSLSSARFGEKSRESRKVNPPHSYLD